VSACCPEHAISSQRRAILKIRSFKNILFYIQREICSPVSFFLETPSPESVPLFIIVVGVSQIHFLRPCVRGHSYMDCDPHQFTFEDLINHSCNFSENWHPDRYMLLVPEVLTALDLSNCQIPCYDLSVITIVSVESKLLCSFVQLVLLSHSVNSSGSISFCCQYWTMLILPLPL
jgi:hypothetical protein